MENMNQEIERYSFLDGLRDGHVFQIASLRSKPVVATHEVWHSQPIEELTSILMHFITWQQAIEASRAKGDYRYFTIEASNGRDILVTEEPDVFVMLYARGD